MQPLRGDVQRHAAVLTRDREPRFRPERGLVLHPELVLALHDHVRPRRGIAVQDADALEHVPLRVKGRGARLDRRDRIECRRERLVRDVDRLRCRARLVDRVRGDDRDRLADVPHDLVGEDGLIVAIHEAVRLLSRDVLLREDRSHAGKLRGGRAVDPLDARERMRAAERRAVEHPFAPEIARVLELALYLGDRIGPRGGFADHATDLDQRAGPRWRERHALSAGPREYILRAAVCTASRILP